jgi:hypothetical protein
MRDDQVMFRIDCDLHIVADHAGTAPAGRHRAAVGVGQRDLSEVLVAGIDCLELAAIDRNARCRQQTYQAAQFNKLHADLLDRSPTALTEVGNRLVVGSEPAGQALAHVLCLLRG